MNRRIGGLSGLAFILLTLATLFLAPAPPEPSASAAELAAWFRDNAGGIELQAVFFGLAALALVAFAAGVQDTLEPSGGLSGVVSAAWSGVTLLAGGWALSFGMAAVVAQHADRLSEDTIFLGMVVYGAAASVGIIGLALLLIAFAMAAHRAAALPAWTTVVAGLGAAVNIAALATYTTDSSAVSAMLYVGFGAFAIWMIAVSVTMLRADTKESAVRTVGATA